MVSFVVMAAGVPFVLLGYAWARYPERSFDVVKLQSVKEDSFVYELGVLLLRVAGVLVLLIWTAIVLYGTVWRRFSTPPRFRRSVAERPRTGRRARRRSTRHAVRSSGRAPSGPGGLRRDP